MKFNSGHKTLVNICFYRNVPFYFFSKEIRAHDAFIFVNLLIPNGMFESYGHSNNGNYISWQILPTNDYPTRNEFFIKEEDCLCEFCYIAQPMNSRDNL